ncbi:MAG: KpsF/GutQ family sugar-phosphate isomerase [Neisseriaceae bacterium]|nr:KpsF/GutQ family sugar-phosphate isomerase [Neisseriaceae bacterium]
MTKYCNPYLTQAKAVLSIEAEALTQLAERLDAEFVRAVELVLGMKGRLVVTGMGKSGHIASKIAATLASTGTPAFFVHPAEAAHGDLGMILEGDVVLALSYSGESDEVVNVLPALKRKGIQMIAMAGRPDSTLAKAADVFLNNAVDREACPLGLAPTSSTTSALALGDALAVVLMQARQFTSEDFAMSHPAGSLGKRLLVRVQDIMHGGADLPMVALGTGLKEVVVMMSEKSLGFTAVVDANGHAVGIFTDGDLRRLFQTRDDLKNICIDEVMGHQPKTIAADKLANEALHVMQKNRIGGLLAVDEDNVLVGALNMQDLLRAGIV